MARPKTKKPARQYSEKPALRAYRKKHNLTVDEAGDKIDVAGSTWRSYENGTRQVDADTCLLIEKELGIEPGEVRKDLFGKVEA